MATKNPRKKKLDAISTKIAMFMVTETFTDEQDAQKLLGDAIALLDKAVELLVASDEQEAAQVKPTVGAEGIHG